MNLRILKKLSKRSVPYLPLIGDKREVFLAGDENYHGLVIRDMSRLDRVGSCHSNVIDRVRHVVTLQPKCRAGMEFRFVKCSFPVHPLPGTFMVGEATGYFEPEWEEETAWEALRNWVYSQFWEYDQVADHAYYSRRFHGPRDIFRTADELLALA